MGLTRTQESDIIKKHSGLARHLAAKFAGHGHDVDDLHQEALIALLKAARNWSETGGASLETVAAKYIRNHLCNVIGVVRRGSRVEGPKVVGLQRSPVSESLDATRGGDDGPTLHDTIASSDPTPDVLVMRKQSLRRAQAAFAGLTEREAKVVVDHVLLDKPLRQMGVELGVSAERVRQIEVGALDTLRQAVGA